MVRASLWAILLASAGVLFFFLLADAPAAADPHVRTVRLGVAALVLCGAASGLALLARGLLDLATRAEIAARRPEPVAASLASELADAVTALLDELSHPVDVSLHDRDRPRGRP